MGKRAAIGVAVGGAALAACALLACGSSRPGDASFNSVNDEAGATSDSGTRRASGGGGTNGMPLCVGETDSGFREPAGSCTCVYAFSTMLSVTLPCGVTFCSEGKREAAACSTDARLTLIPDVGLEYCQEGGGAYDVGSLPPCEAGAPTTDAAAIADAASTD